MFVILDILGEGELKPRDMIIKGPLWARGMPKNWNEFQRLNRRLKFLGPFYKEYFPTKHSDMNKRFRFLYRRFNQRLNP